jgi:hypothetical protein
VAGYSGTPLVRKLGIREGTVVAAIGAPSHFPALLGDLPDGARLGDDPRADMVVVFATERAGIVEGFGEAMTRIPADGAIWVAWPKRSSGVATDLTEDVMRELFLPTGMVDTKVCAIDETWSGLRFVVRVEHRPGWRQ